MMYLGDLPSGQAVWFCFGTNDRDGAAVNPSAAGNVLVFRNDGEVTALGVAYSGTGNVVNPGVHSVVITTTASPTFYAAGYDFCAVLVGATIDGQSVNAPLAHFSVQRRYPSPAALADAVWDELSTGHTDTGKAGRQLWTDVDEVLMAAAAIRAKTDPLPNSVADAVLQRDVDQVEASAPQHSLCTVVLAIANKANTEDNPGKLTVYRTDGETEHCQIDVSTDAEADPIDGIG